MAANSKLDWLKSSSVEENVKFSENHVYTDIKLDLRQNTKTMPDKGDVFNSITNRGNDIDTIHDTDCIMHSLRTLFSTKPGDRILVPEYGCNLYKYIGKPITDLLCDSIAAVLKSAIRTWEPRVRLDRILVTPTPDEHIISIKLYITIPEIRKKHSVGFTFNSSTGYLGTT